MKTIRFHRAVEKELKRWPDDIRQELADLLALVAGGQLLSMPVSWPLPTVYQGAHELRLHDRSGQFRVFYFVKIANAIVVFHAFKKKTQKTPAHEIETALARLKELL